MTSGSDVTQWQALADGYPQVKSISRPFEDSALSCLISRHRVPALLDLLRRYLQRHGMEREQLGEGLPDYLVLAQRWKEYSHWHNGEPELAAEQI